MFGLLRKCDAAFWTVKSFSNLNFRVSVHIDVIDVDDSALERKQRSYYAEVIEGKSYEKLIHLDMTASEDDVFGEVCTYRILTPNVPFEVDADG